MISHLITILTSFIVHVISTLGYPGVALLMGIESAAIPLPSEIIMPFAGFLASEGRFNLFALAIAGGVGSAVGSALTYWIGKVGGRPLVERYGKYVLISAHDIEIADKFFARFGNISTFIGRLLPVVRTFISIPAGIAKVPFWPFVLYSFIGSAFWSYLLAYFGFKLGPAWMQLRERAHWVDTMIIILLALFCVWWVYRHFARNKKATHS